MPRVVFVNRYFHPDHSATSQIVSDLAFALAQRGWDVAAISGRQSYGDPHARLVSERIQGVDVQRIWSTRFGRSNLAGRAIDYLTFYLSAFFAIRRAKDAVVVATTDPPLLSVIAALASKRVVNWTHDLFPEVATELGLRLPKLLVRMRDWSLRRAKANVVLGDAMATRVPRATVIHNWADAQIEPVSHEQNALRSAWNLDGFVVGYSGNLGRAHDLDTITRASQIVADRDPSVRFLFIGAGAKLSTVKQQAAPTALFLPYQPRVLLRESLSAADAHFVSLEPRLEGLIVPSKFYGVLAAGRPVLFIGATDGELARIIREADCGIVVASGDAAGLADAICALAADPERAQAMGRRGRALHDEQFAPHLAIERWEQTLRGAL